MTDTYKIETVQLCVPVSDAPDGKTVYPNLLDCDNALHGKGYKPNPKPSPSPSQQPPYLWLGPIIALIIILLFCFYMKRK